MKNLLKSLTVLLVAVVFVSCSKDQAAVNKLEGTWAATSVVTQGLDYIAMGATYSTTFADCKKGATDCAMTTDVTFLGSTETINATYTVGGDGTMLIVTTEEEHDEDEEEGDDHAHETHTDTMTITTLTKTDLVITTDNDGEAMVITMAKQ